MLQPHPLVTASSTPSTKPLPALGPSEGQPHRLAGPTGSYALSLGSLRDREACSVPTAGWDRSPPLSRMPVLPPPAEPFGCIGLPPDQELPRGGGAGPDPAAWQELVTACTGEAFAV